MKTIKLSFAMSVILSALTACGGGGGSDTVANNLGSAQDSTGFKTNKVGYFIDSAVAGVDYETSSGIKGKTSSTGQFNYQSGDTVTFKLGGKLELGSATPDADGLITPKALAQASAKGDAKKADENEVLMKMKC